jgi:hypothetical protein
VTPSRSYDGPAIDGTVQHISEAPHWQDDGETVDVVDDRLDAGGGTRVEDVPELDGRRQGPNQTGQTKITEWGGSA